LYPYSYNGGKILYAEMATHIVTFLTTRSQYARVQKVLECFAADNEIELDIILAGGSLVHDYGELQDTLADAGLNVTRKLHTLLEGDEPVTQAKTTGLGLVEFASVINDLCPDAVLTTGDRYETLATTIATTYLNTVVIHLEGGEVTGSIDDRVRHATTKMSDYHFVSTQRSKRIVRGLGEGGNRVYRTGCPSIDLCKSIREDNRDGYDPQDEYGGVGPRIDTSNDYLVVQYHPLPTDYGSMYSRTWELINAVDSVDIPAFWFWPNPDSGTEQVAKAMREYRGQREPDDAHFYVNLNPYDFLTLVSNSACVVGNSSVGIRECSYFGVPTVNIGDRQVYREQAENVTDVSAEEAEIREAIENQLRVRRYDSSDIYGDGTASQQITEILRETNLGRKGSMDPSSV
jgi:UDP-hydrolysing UDP-N-acetyl-D-glucosamine 2-epimerase